MVLETQSKGRNKSLEKQRPGPPDRAPPGEEGSASQAQPRAVREPPPPRTPLPRGAGDSAPLPQPASKCPRRRREKQEVQAGAQGADPAREPEPPASGSAAPALRAPARRPSSEPAGPGRGGEGPRPPGWV